MEPPRRQEREGFLAFSPFLCALRAFAVQIPGTAKAGRPRIGCEYANARIRPARWRKVPTYRENRGWNCQEREGFPAFSPSLCALRAFAVQIPGTAKAGRPRIGRECTNAPGPVAQVSDLRRENRGWNRQDAKSAKVFLLLSFAPFAPLRFKPPEPPKRAVHETDANTRTHEYARPGSASFQLTEKIAVGTAKTRRARRFFSFSSFLCALCAFAVQTLESPRREGCSLALFPLILSAPATGRRSDRPASGPAGGDGLGRRSRLRRAARRGRKSGQRLRRRRIATARPRFRPGR